MRCLNLARVLNSRGSEVIFVCCIHPDSIHNSLVNNEFTVLEYAISSDHPLPDTSSLTEYSSWLGAPQGQDAIHFISILHQNSILDFDHLIVEHSAFGELLE